MSPEIHKDIGRYWSVDGVTAYQMEDHDGTQVSYIPPDPMWKTDFERLVNEAATKFGVTADDILKRLDTQKPLRW